MNKTYSHKALFTLTWLIFYVHCLSKPLVMNQCTCNTSTIMWKSGTDNFWKADFLCYVINTWRCLPTVSINQYRRITMNWRDLPSSLSTSFCNFCTDLSANSARASAWENTHILRMPTSWLHSLSLVHPKYSHFCHQE